MTHHAHPSRVHAAHPPRLMLRVDACPRPRTRGMVRETSMLLREQLLETLDETRARTGRDLPGPLPAGQTEDDPETGLVDEEPR